MLCPIFFAGDANAGFIPCSKSLLLSLREKGVLLIEVKGIVTPVHSYAENPKRSILAAVHIADALEHERGCNSIQGSLVTIDIEYLKELGILEKLPQLKEECTMEAGLETEKIVLPKLQ